MRAHQLRSSVIICTGMAFALLVSACGSSHPAAKTTAATVAAAPSTSTAPATPPPAPHLRILSPRPGARVTPTLAIRVSLTHAAARGPKALKYVLDGSFTRVGSRRLVFHGLAPGHHHLLVELVKRPSVRARVKFTVPAPVTVPATTTPAPVTTTSAAAPPTTTPGPPPATSTTQAPPAPTPPPAPSGGIPQGPNAGDGDADNHGGPTDGDGNI